ncbi:MAG: phospho-N-acetylmuramoyl-pentapeptide-transferase [Actinobacteria bacterium HGW-Actinobacteria-1]|jgi:phospho-N-acetylmuramoyl-pentapeptide-transferase|nr:MAG: phospho-N-acetylmuramoyl-pentapeptide-transferase [Actinobacteria bacterium HGW-Actinobacteria-1]
MFSFIPAIERYPTYQVFLVAVLALVLSGALFPLWIRLLRYRNIGQQVRADGPQGHLVKQGTPTMGGVLILIVVSAIYLGSGEVGKRGVIALIAMLACGLLGFVDDYAKVVHERSLGLRPRAKIIGQAVVAIVVALTAVNWADLSSHVMVPFVGDLDLGILTSTLHLGSITIVVPWLYLVLVWFMVVGESNAVNLTDGLDGLAAGSVMIVMLAYAAIAFRQGNLEVVLFAAAVAGACLGFLWYNSYPADIFMGDTGSLGLGAAMAALAIVTKTELLLVLIGGIYLVETLSVVLQVLSFKLTGKRIFRMAPIHHHFEMKGWSETKIMVRFWIITGILAGAGFALYIAGSLTR